MWQELVVKKQGETVENRSKSRSHEKKEGNTMEKKNFRPDRILAYFQVEWKTLIWITISGLIYNLGPPWQGHGLRERWWAA